MTTSMTAAQSTEAARQKRRNDPEWEQKRLERSIAAPHIGRFEWRLVFEAVWGIGGCIVMIALALAGHVPYWLTCLVNGVLGYCLYMPLHEATHNNIQGRRWQLRWLNDRVGQACAPFVGFSYQAHQISHMRHHAYTNDPRRDPDFYVAGSFWQIPSKLLLISYAQLLLPVVSLLPASIQPEPKPGSGTRARMLAARPDPVELQYMRRFGLLQLGAMLGLSLAGYFWEVLFLYYLPTRIGLFIILVTFAWLPHHPHSERGRYRDTRVTLFPMSRLLLRGQDRHIIHHMHPLIPHYRIPAVFAEMRPMLEERGVRIEGPLAGPGSPPLLLRFDPAAVRPASSSSD